jgi:pSer/pThr/pTyr-binding forkhead associated (FHA) protein
VKDLESTNGTFVNGKRITTAELKDGDTLAVGRFELTVSRAE